MDRHLALAVARCGSSLFIWCSGIVLVSAPLHTESQERELENRCHMTRATQVQTSLYRSKKHRECAYDPDGTKCLDLLSYEERNALMRRQGTCDACKSRWANGFMLVELPLSFKRMSSHGSEISRGQQLVISRLCGFVTTT
eukprot:TRINITY_DN41654_c0_g1_i1.p1 TRINITY_DN41654_c0_g1~~TRINITY_DN41654_c0_g1_i1.p1  ORF type:complete len:141 (+),score=11.00 TRINITY_DN41654_c0_g1_i1:419-841(+)